MPFYFGDELFNQSLEGLRGPGNLNVQAVQQRTQGDGHERAIHNLFFFCLLFKRRQQIQQDNGAV
jgi:hypothetical protein